MLIAALFTIAKRNNSNEFTRLLMGDRINKMFILKILFILYVTYYLGLKWKDLLKHTTSWVNLESIMPSEISQTRKDKHYMIPHM